MPAPLALRGGELSPPSLPSLLAPLPLAMTPAGRIIIGTLVILILCLCRRRCRETGAGSSRLARKSNEDRSSRERGRDKSGIWIRAGGAEKEGAIRLKSSTALMDSNANIVAVVASENGKSANNTSAVWRRRRETLSRRPFYRPCPDGGVTFGHRRQGRDKRE